MSKYDEAKEIAQKLVDLEIERKEIVKKQKELKANLLDILENNSIDSMFEFQNGICCLESKTTFKISDGFKQETKVTSKSPDKISPDFVETFFVPDLKLSKIAKKEILEDNTDILSILVPEEKQNIKITTI